MPVFTVARINDPLIAESIVASGKADGVVMGRASLADPEVPNKAREGRFEDIIQCTACMQGCETRVIAQLPVRCTVNPRTGRENEFAITPAPEKKKVFVAGGGPAGMEAAIVAAQRGHDVTLFEKDTRLGGQFYLAAIPPWKGEISTFLAWQGTPWRSSGSRYSEHGPDRRDRQGPEARCRDRGNRQRARVASNLRARPAAS